MEDKKPIIPPSVFMMDSGLAKFKAESIAHQSNIHKQYKPSTIFNGRKTYHRIQTSVER